MSEFAYIPGYISFERADEEDEDDTDQVRGPKLEAYPCSIMTAFLFQPQMVQIWHCVKSGDEKVSVNCPKYRLH